MKETIVYRVEIMEQLKNGEWEYNNDISYLTKDERDEFIKNNQKEFTKYKAYECIEMLYDEEIQCIKDNGYYDL